MHSNWKLTWTSGKTINPSFNWFPHTFMIGKLLSWLMKYPSYSSIMVVCMLERQATQSLLRSWSRMPQQKPDAPTVLIWSCSLRRLYFCGFTHFFLFLRLQFDYAYSILFTLPISPIYPLPAPLQIHDIISFTNLLNAYKYMHVHIYS